MKRSYKGNLVLSEEICECVDPMLAWIVNHAGKFNFQIIGSGLIEYLEEYVKELQDAKLPIAIGACVAYGALWSKRRLLQGREETIELPVYDGDTFKMQDAATRTIYKGQKEQFE